MVLCFFQDVLLKLRDEGVLVEREDVRVGSEIGRNPVYQLHNQNILVLHPGVGAPLAGAFLEEMIATGSTVTLAVNSQVSTRGKKPRLAIERVVAVKIARLSPRARGTATSTASIAIVTVSSIGVARRA